MHSFMFYQYLFIFTEFVCQCNVLFIYLVVICALCLDLPDVIQADSETIMPPLTDVEPYVTCLLFYLLTVNHYVFLLLLLFCCFTVIELFLYGMEMIQLTQWSRTLAL